MARLIVHPGAPKTGTSTLQRFLHQNREALARQGVAALTPTMIRNSAFMRACRKAARGERPLNRRVVGDFAAEYADYDTVLISEEGFCSGFLPGALERPAGLERAVLAAEVIAALPFDDIRVILTIRRQRGLLVSSYVHRVKLHRERRGFGRWLREVVAPDRLSWAGVAAEFEAVLGPGRLTLLPFEIVKAEGSGAYARAFFDAAGLCGDGVDFSLVNAANLSASHPALLASLAFNRITFGNVEKTTVNEQLSHYFPSSRFRSFLPKDAALDVIAAIYAAENEALARRYFPDYEAAFLGAVA
ncbi:MAG: hypothetical protein ACK5MQ_12820 [Pikeienuella sp.]